MTLPSARTPTPLRVLSEVRVRQGREDKKAIVAVGFGTDKELNPIAPDLVQIVDDRKVLPAYYYAGSLVNRLLLKKFPNVGSALSKLKGILSLPEMVSLLQKHDEVTAKLGSVEAKKKAVEDIAREFLQSKGVLAKS
jgi:glycine betaine/choline ABC-type transport system substrate-binding protein